MFKRTNTTLDSGEYRGVNAARGADYLERQPVRIVKQVADSDDGEDRYRVQTFAGFQYDVDGCDLNPHPQEAELNTEFMERIMTTGSPLMQGFVIQAIEQFAKAVLTAPAKTEAEDTGMISDRAWRECAQFTLGNIVARDEERKERDARARQFA